MKKILFGIFVFAMAFFAVSCSGGKARVIKVGGSGEVTYVPDMVTMTVTVREVKPALKDAVQETNTTCKKILSLCKEYSVPEEDVKTSYAQTGKEYRWQDGKEVFLGYNSEQSLQITFKELNRLESFTGDILSLQVYSLGNFKYGHTKKTEFESEANLLALDNARTAAEKMAERLGVKVGKVLYISDIDSGSSMGVYAESADCMVMNKSMNRASGIVVAPGILSSTKAVAVAFEIK